MLGSFLPEFWSNGVGYWDRNGDNALISGGTSELHRYCLRGRDESAVLAYFSWYYKQCIWKRQRGKSSSPDSLSLRSNGSREFSSKGLQAVEVSFKFGHVECPGIYTLGGVRIAVFSDTVALERASRSVWFVRISPMCRFRHIIGIYIDRSLQQLRMDTSFFRSAHMREFVVCVPKSHKDTSIQLIGLATCQVQIDTCTPAAWRPLDDMTQHTHMLHVPWRESHCPTPAWPSPTPVRTFMEQS